MKASHGNNVMDFFRDAFKEASVLWWSFFDWLALVDWRQLYITWFLAFAFGIVLNLHEVAIWFILIFFCLYMGYVYFFTRYLTRRNIYLRL